MKRFHLKKKNFWKNQKILHKWAGSEQRHTCQSLYLNLWHSLYTVPRIFSCWDMLKD